MIVMVGKRDLASIAEKLIDGIDRASDALANEAIAPCRIVPSLSAGVR